MFFHEGLLTFPNSDLIGVWILKHHKIRYIVYDGLLSQAQYLEIFWNVESTDQSDVSQWSAEGLLGSNSAELGMMEFHIPN